MALERELHEAIEELGVGDARRLEELCVDARGGEARDRIQLVHDHLAVVTDEAVRPRHSLAVGGEEGSDRETKEPDPALATAVVEAAAARGLLLLKAGMHGNCIRVLVPLVISEAELDEALGVWEDALEQSV